MDRVVTGGESLGGAGPRAAYVHVPFCRHRCGYCNFTVVAGRDDLIAAYIEALERELSWLETPRDVDTLFFGGGTPTHLPAPDLERLLRIATHWFRPRPGGEFSVEANPADLDEAKTELLAAAGVTRISLGVQSFSPAKLSLLERDHRREEIERSAALVRRQAASLAVDLIFAAPGETLDGWRDDLQNALALSPDHISTYGLTFEKGAAFWARRETGALRPVTEDTEADMYELAIDLLTAAGFQHYEVSNFARPGQRCRHNETYWLGGEYYAAGPGAARYVNGCRELNHRSTTAYIQRVRAGESPVVEREVLTAEGRARERLVFGLRRLEGLDRRAFHATTGYAVEELVGQPLRRFLALGLLAESGPRLHLTRAGLLVSDSLWPDFLAAGPAP